MSSSQLDILALEPFFGGGRRAMLETIMRYSRHRWTLLRLPPRRIDRRLAAAAHWFSEQLSRHWFGRVDILFTSEAMNLADLLRMVPDLGGKPSVVYFHDNQLPAEGMRAESPLHLVNLTTANAASEIWFNSIYHLKTFLRKATALVEGHPELSARNPLPELTGKAHLMPPPVDLTLDHDVLQQEEIKRDPRVLFVDTRDADLRTLNFALGVLERRGEKVTLVTIGPVVGLECRGPRITIAEQDEIAQIRALHQAGVMLSTRPHAPSDYHAVRALNAGCWPIFPDSGVYPELLPEAMHHACLYETGSGDRLATQIQNTWLTEPPAGYERELSHILARFNALEACHAMDERLEQIARPAGG
ncbi:MAG: DUF3524 domain-containing protein [Tepidisphaerales bacterium]